MFSHSYSSIIVRELILITAAQHQNTTSDHAKSICLPVWPQQCSPWLLLLYCFLAFIPSQSLSHLCFSPPLCAYSVLCFSSLFPTFAQIIEYYFFICTKLMFNTHFTGLCLFLNAIIMFFPGSFVLIFPLKLSPISPPSVPLLKYLLKWKVFWLLGIANQHISLFSSETCTQKDFLSLSCWVWKVCSEVGEEIKWCNLFTYL